MKRINLRVSDLEYQAITAIALKYERSINDLVREGLRMQPQISQFLASLPPDLEPSLEPQESQK